MARARATEDLTCLGCGATYYKSPSHDTGYCSRECRVRQPEDPVAEVKRLREDNQRLYREAQRLRFRFDTHPDVALLKQRAFELEVDLTLAGERLTKLEAQLEERELKLEQARKLKAQYVGFRRAVVKAYGEEVLRELDPYERERKVSEVTGLEYRLGSQVTQDGLLPPEP